MCSRTANDKIEAQCKTRKNKKQKKLSVTTLTFADFSKSRMNPTYRNQRNTNKNQFVMTEEMTKKIKQRTLARSIQIETHGYLQLQIQKEEETY